MRKVTLDLAGRAWLLRALGACISSKQLFLWCERIAAPTLDIRNEELAPGKGLIAANPDTQYRDLEIPDFVRSALMYMMYDDPDTRAPRIAYQYEIHMAELLGLQVYHGQD